MDYHEAANVLFDLRRYPTKPGTASTAALLEELGAPQDALTCVQVAGSNGKGSTVRMLECVLREAGYSVGRYTSPHLADVRERFVVDGREIPGRAVADFVEECGDYLRDSAASGEPTTFFEATTALALWYFERRDVDVALLEVGIGGQYDATSVVDPIASAVTNVTLEHTDVLGDTIAAIARDKAAVAPDERPLVTGATGEALATIKHETDGAVRTVGFPEESPDLPVTYDGLSTPIESAVTVGAGSTAVSARLPLQGRHQARNAGVATALARQVLDHLCENPDDALESALSTGLRRAHWPGRTEVVSREPLVMLDGAHNPGACAELAGVLEDLAYDELFLVFGALVEKDHPAMAHTLPEATHVVACEPDRDRGADGYVLREVFRDAGYPSVERIHAVSDAVAAARERAGPDDLVLVTGSLYTVGEARERWTGVQVPKRVESVRESKAVLHQAGVTEAGTKRMRGKGTHRVVHTRVRRRQADYLKQELLSIGGECAVSKLQREEEFVDVVMMGTLAQFRRLLGALEPQPYGLSRVGEDVRSTLGIGASASDHSGTDPMLSVIRGDGTAVMGILNATPDSFHDGGQYEAVEDAVTRARALVAEGADIVDVGGESTRPGADPVPVETEIERVLPVIESIAELDAAISIDTRKAAVAEAALDAGANMINDVSGLADPDLRLLVAERGVPVVLMHSIETPVDPDRAVEYDDVVEDVIGDLTERIALARAAGVDLEQIVVDPGLGFGKSAEESFALLDRLPELRALGCPVLIGHSQKSMFGQVGYDPGERTYATVGATALAAERGADVVRVHDVAENVAAVGAVEGATRPDR